MAKGGYLSDKNDIDVDDLNLHSYLFLQPSAVEDLDGGISN